MANFQIILSNFKNTINEKSFIFNKDELIHLTGKSGAGKSTIFCAFEWVLYGKLSGIKPRSKKDLIPKVKLLISNKISITREGNDLNVITENGVHLTSDVAQGHIFLIFGDKDLWKSCSYLEQGYRNLLLTGSGEEKLKILRDLTYGYGIGQENDPDYYLNKIKENIKKAQQNKKIASSLYDSYYEETIKSLDKYRQQNNKWEESEYEIDELRSIIKSKTEEYKKMSSIYNTQKLICKDLREFKNRLNKIILNSNSFIDDREYDEKVKEIEDILQDLHNKSKDISLSEKIKEYFPYEISSKPEVLEDLISKKGIYLKFKEMLDRYNLSQNITMDELKEIKNNIKINELYNEKIALDESEDYIIETNTYIDDLKIKIRKLEDGKKNIILYDKEVYTSLIKSLGTIEKSISNFNQKKSFVCPTCKDRLFMNEKGTLDVLKDINIDKLKDEMEIIKNKIKDYDEIKKINDLIEKMKKDIESTKKDLDNVIKDYDSERHKDLKNMKDNLKKINKIPQSLSKNPKAIDDLIHNFIEIPDEKLIKKYRNGNNIVKLLGNKVDEFLKNPSNFINLGILSTTNLKSIKSSILSYEEELRNLSKSLEKKKKALTEKEFLENEISKLESKLIDDFDENIMDKIEKELEELRSLEIDWVRYTEMESKMDNLNKYDSDLEIANKNLNKLEILYENVKKLSIEPIENVIECINFRLNEYLDILFSESNIKIILSLFKQVTTTGSKKDSFTKISVNLQVYNADSSYPNISSLSGGEADRVSLALTLTLAEIAKSPLILLDECMASLDSELRETSLRLIKNTALSTGACIIDICHESVEGYHDSIININSC